jgi:hypothetical protein
MLVTIDPGVHSGWALWGLHGLIACGLGDPRSCKLHRVTSDDPDVDTIRDVWIERPVVYPHSPVRPNDLITLALDAGRWAGIYEACGVEAHFVTPAEWKGQVPKAIHHARIWGVLSAEAQEVVEKGCRKLAPSKRHNVLDAVGLGLWVRGWR